MQTNSEKMVMENFVALQKVMTNLAVKLDDLSNQISKLLDLFEISAKALAKKEFETSSGSRDAKRIIEKVDNLLEQNKIIARGVSLLHEREPAIQQLQEPSFQQAETNIPTPEQKNIDINTYQRSISSSGRFQKLPRR